MATTPLQSEISRALQERAAMLKKLSGAITRKLSFMLEEKLQKERAEYERLSGIQVAKKQALSEYSLVLDPQFFEQKLL